MSRPTRRIAAAVMTGVSLAVGAPAAALAHDGHDAVQRQLAAAKEAGEKYRDVSRAIADGYVPDDECVQSPEGAMGFHYANRDLIDRELDVREPEVLVYQPDGYGGHKLVALEYYFVDEDQDPSTDGDRPSLFGQPFDGPDEAQGPGLPVNYTLHVWLWQHNPSGMFAPFNPAGSCEV
ncbi:hypothetical protein [Nocardiopsis algeriensis]|uniref:Uncharacterized protein n=1 Tax=Nocardiopsis algeriensis TaxID=1478215 RepID=A0A841J0R2_9ACTN|nr:hypothetical protein [Nocardiopsis algeriensis]MBB6122098.1 hypothetical protein [Nocardiopsis algeriensis]